MLKIIMVLFVFLICCSCVIATDFITPVNYTMNMSSLPFSTIRNVLLGGTVNSTINMTYGNFTSGVNGIYFDVSSKEYDINILIPNGTYPGNYSDFVCLYTNGTPINCTTVFTFNFEIINDTVVPETPYVEIGINNYEYTLCDFMLPWNSTKDITVSGMTGQTIFIDGDDPVFFDEILSFVIPSTGVAVIPIKIHLNKNLTIGTHTRVIVFSVLGDYTNVTFHFIIKDCVIPISSCNNLYDKMVDVCSIINKSVTESLECKASQIDYDTCIYDVMVDAAEKITINNTIIEYVNTTSYKEVLSLEDAEVVRALKDIPLVWKQMQVDLKQKGQEITDKDITIAGLQDELATGLSEKINTIVNPLVETNQRQANTIGIYERLYMKKSSLNWMVFWVLFLVGCVLIYMKYDENNFW